MAFHHSTTFLRSALARDPFCHGDIITAEDVIRLEAKFPALFDKPVPSPRADDASSVTSDDFHFDDSPRKAMSTVSTGKAIPKKKSTRSGPIPVVQTRPKSFSGSRSGPPPRKPVVCRYHQKCFTGAGDECRTEVERRSNEILRPASDKFRVAPRRLIRPSSLSLEDLRETLKQVLEEEQRPNRSRQFGTRSQPSPYTEDLVKKFFGKKLEELRKQKMQLSKGRGQGRELVNTSSAVRPSSQNSNPPKKSNPPREHPSKRTENVHRVGSASSPGFIRGTNELPRAPPPKLGVTYQSKRTNSGLSVSGNSTPRVGKIAEGHGNRQLTWVGSQHKGVDFKRQEVAEKHRYIEEKSEDSDTQSIRSTDTDDRRAAIRDTRVIHLTCPKHLCKPEVKVHQELPRSSYHQLLAARQATGNLETKAILRKQDCADRNFPLKRNQNSHHSLGYESEDAPFQYEDHHRFQIERKTSETLEKIAGELVYTEILHQLNELKQEQGTRQKVNWGPAQSKSDHLQLSPSSSEQEDKPEKVLPNFVPTTTTEGEDDDDSKGGAGARRSVSEIVLKTPDLTPTPTAVDRKVGKAVRDEDDTDFSGSLKTPQLSPRSPRNPVAARPSQEVQMKSPDMSDFVPSQHDHTSEEKKEEPKVNDANAKETEGLKTPQLSESLHIIPDPNPPGWNDNIPEKDESTLSGIDTFSESVHQVDPNAKNDEEDKTIDEEDKVPSKYSDDFIPEMGSIGDAPPVSATLPPPDNNNPPPEPSRNPSSSLRPWLSEADTDNESVLENLNTSRETVIDMLSEGEFIGDVLRSPGELSIRQKWAPTEKLISPMKTITSEQVSSTGGMSTESTLNGERTLVENDKLGEYEISLISEGVHLLSMDRDQDQSVGTSLGEL